MSRQTFGRLSCAVLSLEMPRQASHVDNRNEVREHTNPLKADSNRNRRPDGLEDADHDGLDNAGEDASGDDPIDRDTDGDGIPDGAEHGGWIASFDGTTLTLKLFAG